jgi:hypothetical protein
MGGGTLFEKVSCPGDCSTFDSSLTILGRPFQQIAYSMEGGDKALLNDCCFGGVDGYYLVAEVTER